MDETVLEKVWGPLFRKDGRPTARLSQLLRGLAMHIIEDYSPCQSIVITPKKMEKYYKNTSLKNELYPWSRIFEEYASLSRMYRYLRCQHHLIQTQNNEKPDIPSLTPSGFEQWVTLLIQAHPENEYRRLSKVILNAPISDPDNIRERFPKEIPRSLFPISRNKRIHARLESLLSDCIAVELGSKQPKSRRFDNNQPPTLGIVEQSGKIQNRHVRFILPKGHRTHEDLDRPSCRGTELPRRLSNYNRKGRRYSELSRRY